MLYSSLVSSQSILEYIYAWVRLIGHHLFVEVSMQIVS